MRVNQVSTLLNIPISTILYYERKGLITPKRKENNYRSYDQNDIRDLKMIYLMKEANIPINQIKKILLWNQKDIDYKEHQEEAKNYFLDKKYELQKQILYIQKIIQIIDNLPLFSNTVYEGKQKYQMVTQLIETLFSKTQEE